MTATLLDARDYLELYGFLYEAGIEHFGVFCRSEVCEVTTEPGNWATV
jgi:hypothetical protein